MQTERTQLFDSATLAGQTINRQVTNACRWFPSRESQQEQGRDGRRSGWWTAWTPTGRTRPQTHCTAATFNRHSLSSLSVSCVVLSPPPTMSRHSKGLKAQIKIPRHPCMPGLLYRQAISALKVSEQRCNTQKNSKCWRYLHILVWQSAKTVLEACKR